MLNLGALDAAPKKKENSVLFSGPSGVTSTGCDVTIVIKMSAEADAVDWLSKNLFASNVCDSTFVALIKKILAAMHLL